MAQQSDSASFQREAEVAAASTICYAWRSYRDRRCFKQLVGAIRAVVGRCVVEAESSLGDTLMGKVWALPWDTMLSPTYPILCLLFAQEGSLTVDLMKQISPQEAEILRDPTICAIVRFR